jgi:tetratricopeptide (TPR) repeat protein
LRDRIFINYRRDDARGASGRISDWLRIAFGRDKVFRDVSSLGVGRWREKIDEAMARSSVCVAVIGPRWANADNLRRLHDEHDMVRVELVRALSTADLTLVPTLVEEAALPEVAILPAVLRPLFESWNAQRITEAGWEDDIRRLVANIAAATRLPVQHDLDKLLQDVAAVQARVAELERTCQLQAGQIEALQHTIDELRYKLAEATAADRPALADAFAELARGNPQVAEDAFEREYDAQSRAASKARAAMAEAARNVAHLALLRDVAKAVSFYRKALEAEPDHAETARLLGRALTKLGDVHGAEAALSNALRIATTQEDVWEQIAVQVELGDVLQRTQGLPSADRAFSEAMDLAEQYASASPDDPDRQYDLAITCDRIGNVRFARGDRERALAAYWRGMEIRVDLASRNAPTIRHMQGLVVSCNKLGDVLIAGGDPSKALDVYRKALVIATGLAALQPSHPDRQHCAYQCHERLGAALVADGRSKEALHHYGKALATIIDLASRDPANTDWQRDLFLCHFRMGEISLANGESPAALIAIRKAHRIAETLAARYPTDMERQYDLAATWDRIAQVSLRMGAVLDAIVAGRKGLAIMDALVTRDPSHTQWQHALAKTNSGLGTALSLAGKPGEATDALRKALEIYKVLATRDPAQGPCQKDLAMAYIALAGLGNDGEDKERADHLVCARQIMLKQAACGRADAGQWIAMIDQGLTLLAHAPPPETGR